MFAKAPSPILSIVEGSFNDLIEVTLLNALIEISLTPSGISKLGSKGTAECGLTPIITSFVLSENKKRPLELLAEFLSNKYEEYFELWLSPFALTENKKVLEESKSNPYSSK